MSDYTLVTGGAKGLGAEICRTLAAQGHSILVHYNRSEHEAKKVAQKCRQHGVEADIIHGDFSTPQSMQQFIKSLPSAIGSLVNNVGNYLVEKPSKTTPEAWQQLFQVNFHTPVALINALLPGIIKAKGSIINIGVCGLDTPRATTYFPAYQSTKSSLLLATKAFAKELASLGVRVNMVSPGQLENSVDLEKSSIPAGRPGTLHEVAQTVAFLMRPESDYITGQNIEVAGGLGL